MNAEPTVVDDRALVLRVLTFTPTPGPRHPHEGEFSGEQFRRDHLEPAFLRAKTQGRPLLVDLDGTEGYASSFLEEAFGGLARIYPIREVLDRVQIKSDSRLWYIDEVRNEYIPEARD